MKVWALPSMIESAEHNSISNRQKYISRILANLFARILDD
jgi:hypothetical protein